MELESVPAGDLHYMAYVGPPTQYDIIGASQFRLLCALGLRSYHRLLDFGCGSLRAGRLFVVYLDPGGYFGIEPNRWLIEGAVANQLGEDLVKLKQPLFDHNENFDASCFDTQFDFILAQSIYSHTGTDLAQQGLQNFANAIKDDGLIVVTFVEGAVDPLEKGWVYPESVRYRPATVRQMAREAGLHATRIHWFHPRQAWYVMSKRPDRLPSRTMKRYLQGTILFDPGYKASWSPRERATKAFKDWAKRTISPTAIAWAKARMKSLRPSAKQ